MHGFKLLYVHLIGKQNEKHSCISLYLFVELINYIFKTFHFYFLNKQTWMFFLINSEQYAFNKKINNYTYILLFV